MNTHSRIQAAGVILIALLFKHDKLVAQPAPQQRQAVKAGPATLQVTIKGRGEPIVFIPSRGRGVEDFEELSARLVRAGYQAIMPEPRGIGGSTGPLEGINYHDLASDLAAVIRTVAREPVTVIAHAFGTRVARTLAADSPDSVKQLILLAAAGAVPRISGRRRNNDSFLGHSTLASGSLGRSPSSLLCAGQRSLRLGRRLAF